MSKHPFSNRLLSLTLSAALVYVPLSHAGQQQEDQRKIDAETCRRLLEAVGNPSSGSESAKKHPTHNSGPTDWRIIDLSNSELNEFKATLSQAGSNDVVTMERSRLFNAEYRSALEASAPVFSIVGNSGKQGVEALLQNEVGRPEIMVAIPTTADGVNKVFGLPASASVETVRFMVDTSKKFRVLNDSRVLNYAENGRPIADVVLGRAATKTNGMFILVAHNNQGMLRFPDGSVTTVSAVYEALGKNRPGLVVSCDTINSDTVAQNVLLTNRVLDFKDIARGLEAAEQRLASDPKASVGDFLVPLAFALSDTPKTVQPTVKIVAIVIGSLIVIVALGVSMRCVLKSDRDC